MANTFKGRFRIEAHTTIDTWISKWTHAIRSYENKIFFRIFKKTFLLYLLIWHVLPVTPGGQRHRYPPLIDIHLPLLHGFELHAL